MSDILLSSQQQLASALKQLQSAAGTSHSSALTQQASQAIVKHLAGNQLLLQTQKGELPLPNRTLKGELIAGQPYELSVHSKDSSRIIFSPALHLASPVGTGGNISTLHQAIPKALAELLLAQTLTENGTSALTDKLQNAIKVDNGSLTLRAQVTAVQGNRLTLQLADRPLTVLLPKPPPEFTPAQAVQLRYQASGQWTLTPQPQSSIPTLTPSPVKVTIPPNHSGVLSLILPKDTPMSLSSGAIESLQSKTPPVLQPLLPLINQLKNTPQAGALKISDSAHVSLSLSVASANPTASITVSPQQRQQLQQLLPLLTEPQTKTTTEPMLSRKEAAAHNIPLPGATTSASPHPVGQNAETNTVKALQTLLRRIQSMQESPAQSLNRIEHGLKDNVITQSDAAKVVQQLTQQLSQSLPKGHEQDASQLRALLSQPAMALTPLSLTSATTQQGFVGGLVTLLQLSLAARQARNHPSQGDRLAERLSGMLETMTAGSKVSPKALTDFAQAEQRHQIIRHLGRLIASHTGHKATNAENQIQGQDNFYYSLPLGPDSNRKDMELLIRREPPPEDKKNQQQSDQKQWQLTMKLDIGERGGLLAKAKLFETQLELDFYASNDNLKNTVIAFLPMLKKRLTALGIELNYSQCQLGKIPEHLHQRPYQVFETKA